MIDHRAVAVPACAMLLAAGLGRRMRAVSDRLPKPLIEVGGRTLIDRALDRFADAGVGRTVVNLHHKGALIEAALARRVAPEILFSPEPELLETGGGVAAALGLLGGTPFFVANSDALWLNGPEDALHRLAAAWDEGNMDGLLLLYPLARTGAYDGPGDFFLTQEGRLTRRGAAAVAPFLFTGVQILHPRLFEGAPGGAFSLNVLYDRALAEGRLYGLVHDGAWFHVGTPAGLAEAEDALIHGGKAALR